MPSMPFVAVVGGFFSLEPTDRARAVETAEEIGRELAEQGFGLVVYYSDEQSLEPHVVRGFVAAAGKGDSKRIRVRFAQSQREDVYFPEQGGRGGVPAAPPVAARPELFDIDIFPSEAWEAPFYQSLADREGVDAVLLMAGGTSTLIAGQIAVARRLPVLAVDAFGGAAERIWSQLAQTRGSAAHPGWTEAALKARVADLKRAADEAAADREAAARRHRKCALLLNRTVHAMVCAVLFVVLVAAIWLGFTQANTVDRFIMLMIFAGMAAGATGAVARLVLWDPTERDSWSSALLGAVGGMAVAIAYLVSQFVSEIAGSEGGSLTGPVEGKHQLQLLLTVLVSLPAGLGFDTVFARLRNQADSVPVAPPQGGG